MKSATCILALLTTIGCCSFAQEQEIRGAGVDRVNVCVERANLIGSRISGTSPVSERSSLLVSSSTSSIVIFCGMGCGLALYLVVLFIRIAGLKPCPDPAPIKGRVVCRFGLGLVSSSCCSNLVFQLNHIPTLRTPRIPQHCMGHTANYKQLLPESSYRQFMNLYGQEDKVSLRTSRNIFLSQHFTFLPC